MTFAPSCAFCHADFRIADAGDGPVVFMMFAVGAVVTPLAVVAQLGLHAPGWLVLGGAMALTLGLSLVLLPIFKATVFALQWCHQAGEARMGAKDDADDA